MVVTKDTPYEESFAGSFGKFTEDNKELGSLDYIWKVIADKDYVKATAFKGGAAVIAEGWLVSPILDLSTLSKVTLTFTQMSYSAGDKSEFMFKVKKEGEAWKNVDIDMPVGNTFEELLTTVDLSAYAGSKMQFAFAYKNAKTSAANTWNIKNVKVSPNVTEIPSYAMSSMGSVENVILPDSVSSIAEKARNFFCDVL